MTLMLVGLPIILVLLFVYVFGEPSVLDSAARPAAEPST